LSTPPPRSPLFPYTTLFRSALGVVAVVDLFDGFEGLLFLGPVEGADGLGAFERHVFEHVREAGFAGRIVDGAGIHVGVEGNHGGDRKSTRLNSSHVKISYAV